MKRKRDEVGGWDGGKRIEGRQRAVGLRRNK